MITVIPFAKFFSDKIGDVGRVVVANVVWRGLALATNKVARLLLILVAANTLGTRSFGLYSYIVSLASLAFIFSDWGINILLTRDFQFAAEQEDKEKLVSTSLLLKVFVALISACAIPPILWLYNETAYIPLALFFALSIAIGNIRDIAINLFIAVQKSKLEFFVYIAETIGLGVSFFTLFRSTPTPTTLAAVYVLGVVVSAFVSFFLSKKIVYFRIQNFSFSLAKKMLKNGLPLSLFGIASYLFFSTDQLILENYHGYEQVGVYNVASKIILAVAVVPGLINTVLFPYIARYRTDRVKINSIIFHVLLVLIGLAGSFILGIFVFGGWTIHTFFKPEFFSVIPALKLFSFITIPMFAVSLFDYVLIAYNLQKQDFYLTIIAGFINVILNFVLVPHYGMIGAVVASVLSQCINALMTGLYMVHAIKKITRKYALA